MTDNHSGTRSRVRRSERAQHFYAARTFSDEEIKESDLYGVVKPKDKKLTGFKVFVAAEGIRPMDGSIVIVEITHYPDEEYPTTFEGLVKQVIGYKDEPGMDILSIVVANGIPTKFAEVQRPNCRQSAFSCLQNIFRQTAYLLLRMRQFFAMGWGELHNVSLFRCEYRFRQ